MCRSPYSDIAAASATERLVVETISNAEDVEYTEITQEDASLGPVTYNATAATLLDAEHVERCLRRYRSYRPQDNTFQPYGGGPRQQRQ